MPGPGTVPPFPPVCSSCLLHFMEDMDTNYRQPLCPLLVGFGFTRNPPPLLPSTASVGGGLGWQLTTGRHKASRPVLFVQRRGLFSLSGRQHRLQHSEWLWHLSPSCWREMVRYHLAPVRVSLSPGTPPPWSGPSPVPLLHAHLAPRYTLQEDGLG